MRGRGGGGSSSAHRNRGLLERWRPIGPARRWARVNLLLRAPARTPSRSFLNYRSVERSLGSALGVKRTAGTGPVPRRSATLAEPGAGGTRWPTPAGGNPSQSRVARGSYMRRTPPTLWPRSDSPAAGRQQSRVRPGALGRDRPLRVGTPGGLAERPTAGRRHGAAIGPGPPRIRGTVRASRGGGGGRTRGARRSSTERSVVERFIYSGSESAADPVRCRDPAPRSAPMAEDRVGARRSPSRRSPSRGGSVGRPQSGRFGARGRAGAGNPQHSGFPTMEGF